LGAWTGAEEIPAQWVDAVHGWPGYDGPGLVELAHAITR
ncbi:MAG: ADP-ribosylglycohydrolase family protein, partial [Actinomycetales bacterium]|nr:ADP-ribosylglycohydrolase family protein [Actinomycetales bacterium]